MTTDPIHDSVTYVLSLSLLGLVSVMTAGLFLLSLVWVVRGMKSDRSDPEPRVNAP